MNTMKRLLMTALIMFFAIYTIVAQDETPATEAGEDFDLEAVVGLFEEAEDLEDFEKKINEEENEINNLDLNKDDEIDIVKVVEYEEGNTHLLVLQAVIGENDVQDIATVEIEKHSEDEISLQVIGDVDMYGPDYIVEPAKEEGSIAAYRPSAVFVSVAMWRPVRVIFRPGRAIFVSSVVWRPRPTWFRVRRPAARSTWRARSRRWHSPRVSRGRTRHSVRGRNMYSSKRKTSSVAKKNYGPKPTPYNSPSSQQKKATTSTANQNKTKATASPAKASPTKTSSANQQKKKNTSTQSKKRRH